jgi:chorismate synthase
LARRRLGVGRGARMKFEQDAVAMVAPWEVLLRLRSPIPSGRNGTEL